MAEPSGAGSSGRRGNGSIADAVAGAELAAAVTAAAPPGLRALLGEARELEHFRREPVTLTPRDRRRVVDQALVLLERNYVHLPHKVAMHAVNPIQRLRLLRARLDGDAETPPAAAFHAEMSEIFHSLRDLHTNYLLPDPYRGRLAFLPFLVEEFFEGGSCAAGEQPRYLVTKVMAGVPGGTFGAGAVVTHWNGMPIARAIEVNAARYAGSNEAARHARGVESLTIRPLRVHRYPAEDWVVVGYERDGVAGEVRLPWLVAPNLPPVVGDVAVGAADEGEVGEGLTAIGVDLDLDEANRARKLMFAPQVAAAEIDPEAAAPAPGPDEVATSLPGVFRARVVTVGGVAYGHLRVFTFSVDDPGAFVAEFVRLTGALPGTGLILDVRGNGGGHIWASELTLQTLTPRTVTPEPTQFINTEVNADLCRRHDEGQDGIDLGAWLPSIEQSVRTGAAYSNSFPITPPTLANAVGQRYFGPVVLVTDARCYSATDIFAAGFADHEIGPILGVDPNTGAGGANVWTHGLLSRLVPGRPGSPSPYDPLPDGVDMRVSIRRTLRVGDLAGTPVEDLGVQPDVLHRLTRRDLEAGNADLLAAAAALLRDRPVRRLDVAGGEVAADGKLALVVDVAGIDRLDVYVDGRPVATQDVAGAARIELTVPAGGAGGLRIEGFAGGTLVASRREVLGPLASGAVGIQDGAALAPAPAAAVPRRLRFLVHAPGAAEADVRREAAAALGRRATTEPLFDASPPELAGFHAVTTALPGTTDGQRRAAAFQLARDLQSRTGWDVQPDLPSGAMYPPRASYDLALQDPTALAGDSHLPGTDRPAWALDRLNVPGAWAASPQRGRGVLVAQPDTGVTAHPELAPGIDTARQRDLLDGDADATDPLTKRWWWMDNPSHGTATSSVVFSRGGGQVTGAAPEATLVPLRSNKSVVLVMDGDVARAVDHARRTGCHVITMSLGGVGFSPALRAAIRAAIRDGVIVLAAAGNQVGFVVSPANYGEVIAVAATNVDDEPWSGSSHGDAVDVAAPGESVWTARARKGRRGNEYFTSRGSGTSFAVALTAGVAALWLAHHGRDALVARYGADRIHPLFADLLRRTARRPAGWNAAEYGDGIVDAAALLAAPLPAVAPASEGVGAGGVGASLSAEERLAAYLPGRSPATAAAALDSLLSGIGGRRDLFTGEVAYHVTQDRLVRDAVLAAGGALTDGAGDPLGDTSLGRARLRALASPALAAALSH